MIKIQRPMVIDGHHRVVAKMLAGKKAVGVIYNIDTLIGLWLKAQRKGENPKGILAVRTEYKEHLTKNK